jgi:two-component system, cell cycle sensor histidine kinase and response regulator CckA
MKKILVVDNHPVMLKYMRELLENAGHHVWTAEDGLAALDMLKLHTPEVVFVDLIMPNISGDKLCRIIRRMPGLESVYVVVLSGIAAEEKIHVAEFGANACIAKGPFATLSTHIFKALEDAGPGQEAYSSPGTIGLDDVHPREITHELLSVKRHFEVILDSMMEGILEIVSDERIVYANPTAAAMIGIPEESLLGSRLTDFFDETNKGRIRSFLGSGGGAPHCSFENHPLELNGRQVLIKVRPVKDRFAKNIIMLHDVTERLRIESQLQQAQKLEAIGTLAGGIAHDFNNILTAIMGNISLAMAYLGDETKAANKLIAAEQAALRAKDLTQQLLPFSKGGAPIKRAASLVTAVREVCREVTRNNPVLCHVSVPEDLWSAEVDVLQFRQALQHLMNHSVHAMREGGTIIADATNATVEQDGLLHLRPGKYIKITIQDQGSGIPEELICRIFDPYFSMCDAQGGLGLATAYSVIKNHGGTITVNSKLKSGTTFEVYLPALEPSAAWSSPPIPQSPRKQHCILVMDDEAVIRNVVGDMLSHLGYSVAFAVDGAQAIEIYQRAMSSGKTFDGVIMDLTVEGGMGGKEAIQRLRIIDPNVKAVVSSGYSHDPIMSHFKEYGFCGVLDKPYKLSDLNSVLSDLLFMGQPS